MKKLALVFGLLALAACSSSEDGASTDANAAAVKGVDSEKPVDSTSAKPSDYEPPTTSESESEPGPLSCQALREQPARGTFHFDLLPKEVDASKWVDVEAKLDIFEADDHRFHYSMNIDFTTVKSASLFTENQSAPMDLEVMSMDGATISNTELADPWHGDFFGAVMVGLTMPCRNGALGNVENTFIVGPNHNRITITNVTEETITGTFEMFLPNDVDLVARGSFTAPIVSKANRDANGDKPGFRHHPKDSDKITCCKPL